MQVLAVLAAAPLIALGAAIFRAVVLFWPTMILFGAVHSHLSWVPPLSAVTTFLVVALISLLVPTGDASSD